MEGCAVLGGSFGPDAAAVAFDDAFDVGQADAGAFEVAGVVEALEDAEELGGVLGIEAGSVVADEEGEKLGAGGGGFDADLNGGGRAAAGELDGVGQEIGDDLAEEGAVAEDGWEGLDTPIDPAAGKIGLELGLDLGDEGGEMDGGEVEFGAADAGEGEEVVDEGGHADGLGADDAEVAVGLGVELFGGALAEQFDEPGDIAQGCPEVVGD